MHLSKRVKAFEPPFGLAFAKQKDTAFVALNHTLGVLDTRNLTTKLLHQVPLPATSTVPIGGIECYSYPAEGITLTPDGQNYTAELTGRAQYKGLDCMVPE
ncbi:hypothetical protein AC579_9723 [Pseudocercospora musae]|uniref:Uncharacterized protein n=1 Tax=Pseudocercospora musae TaxID=113226 RepID=A0A139HZT0_9PEZI|nr:hypothetical protein AC579_9723 [Pseudocercospora musae]